MPVSPARRLGLAYAAVVIGALGLVPPVAAQMPTRVLFLPAFLRKPILPSDLLARVRDAFGDAGPAASPSPRAAS